jgi:predicted acetyltransferase
VAFSVKAASLKEKPVICSLLQPYLDELFRFPGENREYKDESGIYLYPFLDDYWRDSERFPYLLYSEAVILGFALVRKDEDYWEMSEYYIKPGFRRRCAGNACARDILSRHPGKWKIIFNKSNQPGAALWKKLADNLAKGDISRGELNSSRDYICFSV